MDMGLLRQRLNIMICQMMIISLFVCSAGVCYAYGEGDQRANESSYICGPGYINAAKQKTEAIVSQQSQKKTFWETLIDRVRNNISDNLYEETVDKPKLELQKRVNTEDAGGAISETALSFDAAGLSGSITYNVAIGSGTNQEMDANDRILAEVFDGIRHVYVGYENVGVDDIRQAMESACSGDIVLVKARLKSYGAATPADLVSLKDGVRLYSTASAEAAQATIGALRILNTTGHTEVMGFNIGILFIGGASNVTIVNNTFDTGSRIAVMNCKNVLFKNNIANGYSFSREDLLSNNPVTQLLLNTKGFIILASNGVTFSNNIISATMFGYASTLSLNNNLFYDNTILNFYSNSTVISSENNYEGINGISLRRGARLDSTNDYFSSLRQGALLENEFVETALGKDWRDDSKLSMSSNLNRLYYIGISSLTNNLSPFGIYNLGGSVTIGKLSRSSNEIRMQSYNISLVGSGNYEDSYSLKNALTYDNSLFMMSLSQMNLFGSGFNNMENYALAGAWILESFVLSKYSNGAEMILSQEDMDNIDSLLAVFENPTLDQMTIMEVIAKLLIDISKINAGGDETVTMDAETAQFLKEVAAVLLAQSNPDLLSLEAAGNLKKIFYDLDSAKNDLMAKYEAGVKPYYDELRVILVKNAENLQLNSILSGSLQKKELEDLPPADMDKIIENLKKKAKKSFEEEYVLQEEAKLRQQYVEPNKNMVRSEMKVLMQKATRELSKILDLKT